MSDDLATLGIRLDAEKASRTADSYAAKLDKVAASGKKVEAGQDSLNKKAVVAERGQRKALITLKQFEAQQKRRANTIRVINQAQRERIATEAQVLALAHAEAIAMNSVAAANNAVAVSSNRASLGVGRLNVTMASLVTRATMTTPALAQMGLAMGSFAAGSALMLPILAGVAALGFAFQALTRDAREARDAITEARARLEGLVEQRARGAGGQAAADVATMRELLGQLRSERVLLEIQVQEGVGGIVGDVPQRLRIDRLSEQIAEAEGLIAEGELRVTELLASAGQKRQDEHARLAREADDSRQFFIAQELADTEAAANESMRLAQAEDDFRRILREQDVADHNQAEKDKTEATKKRLQEETKAQREMMRKIRLFAQGANILGGAIGGTAGSTLQGAAGGAATGAAFGGLPGAIVGGIIGGFGGFFAGRKQADEEARARALERAQKEDENQARLINVAEEQVRLLEDQISEQQRLVDTLSSVVENLGEFGDSLKLSSLSPLSPAEQLREARAQFEAVRSLAVGGDISAAESLPETSRRLLQASRAFNASGAGFVSDFNLVQATIELVRGQFEARETVEQQMLNELIEANRIQREHLEFIKSPLGGTGGGGGGLPGGDGDLNLDGDDIVRLFEGIGDEIESAIGRGFSGVVINVDPTEDAEIRR